MLVFVSHVELVVVRVHGWGSYEYNATTFGTNEALKSYFGTFRPIEEFFPHHGFIYLRCVCVFLFFGNIFKLFVKISVKLFFVLVHVKHLFIECRYLFE